jgi:hypothetical protein
MPLHCQYCYSYLNAADCIPAYSLIFWSLLISRLQKISAAFLTEHITAYHFDRVFFHSVFGRIHVL